MQAASGRRAFSAAAASYDSAAALAREVGARMAARLDLVRLAPHRFADIGCAQGGVAVEIALAHQHLNGQGMDLPVVRPVFETYVKNKKLQQRSGIFAPNNEIQQSQKSRRIKRFARI